MSQLNGLACLASRVRLPLTVAPAHHRQRKPDDLEAQEGQRSIAVHALENLGTTDAGITMLRHLLREQIKRVGDGLDPINVMRYARANQKIPTNAWNTILSPGEASVFQASEV